MFAKLIWCFAAMVAGITPGTGPVDRQIETNDAIVIVKDPIPAPSVQEVGLKDKKYRSKSRQSAVSVVTMAGSGSGTYFKIGSHYVVITAFHVVENQEIVIIVGRNNEQVYGQPILKSTKGDIAVLLVPKMSSRVPMKLKMLSEKDKPDIDELIGREVTYTGFPAHHDLLTVDGKIANIDKSGYIIIHSYGWPGSSGSGVFDFKGRFIGVVSAVDLGQWHPQIPPAIVEDMVWVSPIWDLSAKEVESYIENRGIPK